MTPVSSKVSALLATAGLCLSAPLLKAQDLSLLAGGISSKDFATSSYSWQIDYRQHFHPNAFWSLGWINEGHFQGHHRDGCVAQIWATTGPILLERLSFSVGAGVDRYYDTQDQTETADSINKHGFAPIVSASAEYALSNSWGLRLQMNRISPSNNISTTSLLAGVCYSFGDKGGETARGANAVSQPDERGDNEVTVFLGQSVVNTFKSESALASAIEYRRHLGTHYEASASFINEGDPEVARRNGLASQFWFVNRFPNSKFGLGLGVGLYGFLDRKQASVDGYQDAHGLAGIISPTFTYQISRHFIGRFTWNRIVSDYNRDADIFLVGAGYCF